MHIKRFEAESLESALEQVRSALGPDALILSSRSIVRDRRAFGLFARRGVEVQAGIEGARAGTEREPPASEVEALRLELAALRRQVGLDEELRRELVGLRRAMSALRRRTPQTDEGAAGDADEAGIASLVALGLEERHARGLVSDPAAARADGRPASLAQCLVQRIDGCLAVPRSDRSKRIRVFVGPPGAGKTTTLAKLAARNEEGERDIAFVSLGSARLDGRDALRGYAALVDAPYYEARTAEEVQTILSRHPDHLLLADTPGLAPGGRLPGDVAFGDPIAELRKHFGERVSIELVVDATTRLDVARAQRARFAPLSPDRLVLTRIDECESLIPVVNLLLEGDWPALCWWGNGQRVPEDLEIVEPERLVASLLGRSA